MAVVILPYSHSVIAAFSSHDVFNPRFANGSILQRRFIDIPANQTRHFIFVAFSVGVISSTFHNARLLLCNSIGERMEMDGSSRLRLFSWLLLLLLQDSIHQIRSSFCDFPYFRWHCIQNGSRDIGAIGRKRRGTRFCSVFNGCWQSWCILVWLLWQYRCSGGAAIAGIVASCTRS